MIRSSVSLIFCAILIFGSTPFAVYSQPQTQLDSLLSILRKIQNPATAEVVALRNKIGRLYKQRNLKQALTFAEETLVLAERVNSLNELTNAYALVGDLSSLTGDFKRGAYYQDKAAKSLEGSTDSLSLAKKYMVLMSKGGWISPLTKSEEKIGYGLKSLEISTRLKNEESIARAYSELGNAYKNKALYHSKGNTKEDLHDFTTAREYFMKAAQYNKKVNNKSQLAYCLTIWAIMEKQLGFIEKAMELNTTAIDFYSQEGSLLGAALPHSEMADLFYSKNQFSEALAYINKAIHLCEQVGYLGTIDEYYDRKTKILEALHDFKNALASNKLSKQAREKKYTSETAKSVAEIENQYENKLKEEQIRTLSAEKLLSEKQSNQTKIIFSSVIIFLTTSLVGLIAYIRKRQQVLKQLKEKAQLDKAITQTLENQLMQVQLQALQGQMNPHFIYNALSSIQGLILQEDKGKAITYLNDFAQLSRFTLENSRKDAIKIKDELLFLHRYLDLELLRHHQGFTYSIDLDPSIDVEFETIPPMLIQPIVENAIKHGLVPKKTKGKLTIQFKTGKGESDLICIVDDDGVGRAQAQKAKTSFHHSISTEVNEARLKLMSEQQKLQEKYKINIEDKHDEHNTPCGTRVSIFFSTSIPKEDYAKQA